MEWGIFVVVMPALLWAAVLLALCAGLCRLTWRRFRFRSVVGNTLMAVFVARAVFAVAVAIATESNSISLFACLGGILGVFGAPVLFLLEAIGVVVLFRRWPRGDAARRVGFGLWLGAWLLFNLLVFLIHSRSVALCTV